MNIIAVTSCPVGAAHTYMAAAALEKEAKKGGHRIKVETQGGLGFKNKLTNEDVENADVLILATDVVCLEKERFANIKSVEVSVNQCIRKPKDVLMKALAFRDAEGEKQDG
jgi:PTS system fructose-specific IIB component